jgi:DNA gyrase, A subunit|nr:MAG TPA: DNA topoisomerase 2 alpha [Caudoviricetes sp.]
MSETIVNKELINDLEDSYNDYALMVIRERAISNIEDNQKPSSLAVLYSMYDMGIFSSGKHTKCAKIVGYAIGNITGHGDSSAYGALVTMTQDFGNNIPYINPNGNFGSIAGDSPASFRYTECKLNWYTEKILLKDLAKGVVPYVNNYDDSMQIPKYFPSVLPDVLINGNMGIGVGFASYLLPHNLGDVIDLCIAYVKNRNMSPEQMYDIIKGPDFPLGGIINGTDGLKRCYTSGDGYVRVRGEYKIEEDKKGFQRIVITSIPYGTKIPDITVAVGTLFDNGDINIKDIRDETTQKTGMRICIDLAKGESVDRVMSILIHKTPFERVLKPLHNLLINGKFKEKVNIKQIMSSFVDFRETCLHNKFMLDLKKNEDRLHILEGLFIVTKDIDKAVKIIRNAKDTTTAREELMKSFKLSEPQAQYILDLKLARLTKLNMSDAREEEKEVKEKIKTLTRLTRTKSNKDVDEYMIKEWEDVRNIKEAKPYLTRKTKIQKKRDDVTEEDTIPDEPCTIIMTQKGYIKRTDPLDKEQKRGGKGNSVGTLLEGDEIKQVLNVTARQQLVFLTSKGRVYTKKAYEIDSVSKLARGALARNLLSLRDNENIVLVFVNDNDFGTLISCSVKGMVKSTDLKNLKKINANGKNLIGVDNADKIVDIVIIPDSSKERDVLIATHNGMCIRIDSNEIKPTGIGAVGVTGIKLDKEEKDFVSSMCRVDGKTPVIFVTESGYIKRCDPDEFKVQNRNGVGVKCTQTKYNNRIVAMVRKTNDESILIYTKMGKSLVCDPSTIKLVSRSALGVKGIDLQANDIVIGVS